MSDPFAHEPPPRVPLLGAAALVVLSVVAVVAVRVGGPYVGSPAQPSDIAAPVQQQRELRFEDQAQGVVRVVDARTGSTVAHLTSGQDGFVRATLRSLVRDRRRLQPDSPDRAPFVLRRHADGRLALFDPVGGRVVALDAFGPTNAAAFGRFLADGQAESPPAPGSPATSAQWRSARPPL
jgi:putative photosynthetic complex assembly protein